MFSNEEWRFFCRVIGDPDWTREPRFATVRSRKENEDELDRLVEEWTRNYSPEEVTILMQQNGVAAGVVQNCQDLFEDPQLRSREHIKILNHKVIGPHSYYTPATGLNGFIAGLHILSQHLRLTAKYPLTYRIPFSYTPTVEKDILINGGELIVTHARGIGCVLPAYFTTTGNVFAKTNISVIREYLHER